MSDPFGDEDAEHLPAPEITSIEFGDDFHDLMHHWWQGCNNLPLHFRRWREFIWAPRWRAWLFCTFGKHSRLGATWRYGKFIGWHCGWCGKFWKDDRPPQGRLREHPPA